MKKRYLLLCILLVTVAASCSKDFLKSYESRIQGSWRLTQVNRIGFGSSGNPFENGQFIFSENGQLTYINEAGDSSHGNWNIRKRWVQGNCTTDDDGNRNCNDRYIRSLSVAAFNFSTQELRSGYFDEIAFTSTNRFKVYIYLAGGVCVYHFSRQ